MGKRETGVGKNKKSRSKKTKKRLAIKAARLASEGKVPRKGSTKGKNKKK
jgi:hypothetical protein